MSERIYIDSLKEKLAIFDAKVAVKPFTSDHGDLVEPTSKSKFILKNMILDIFMSRDKKTDKSIYEEHLSTFGCIFITDLDYQTPPVGNDSLKTNTNKQQPFGACIVERDISMKGKDTVIFIHHLATKLGKDGYGYASTLLQ